MILGVIAMPMIAQEKLPDFEIPQSQLLQDISETSLRRMPQMNMGVIEVENDFHAAPTQVQHVTPYIVDANKHARKAVMDADKAGYLNPAGTLFCGMDEGGKGTWFKTGAVIGAWSDTIPYWKWINTTTGKYDSIQYATSLSDAYPAYVEDGCYKVDADGNFCDSILANGGWSESYMMGASGDEGYYWQMAVPVQTVYRNKTTTQSFALLSTSIKPDPEKNCSYAAGGLPSVNSADGLWPLTNAINISRANGTSIELIASNDLDGYCHYLFGSSQVNLDTNMTDTSYTRTAPVKLVTRYDKPQAPLYVKSITLAVGAEKYSAFHKEELKIDSLHLEIQDTLGNVIARSDANRDDCSTMSYTKGQMLTFSFQTYSDYQELLHEGFLVSDAFQLVITGFSETDEWGIYAAKCSSYAPKTAITYADGMTRTVDYEPYIMLNGIYTTFEPYTQFAKLEEQGYETGVHGDTIDINMLSVSSPYYSYQGYCYGSDLSELNEFDFYSTFVPYDSITRYWNLDIVRPEYIQIGAGYDANLGTDEDPITLWDYMRLFYMYIYATDTPALGDLITIGKCGRQAVFRIKAIDGATAISEISQEERNADAVKVLKNGLVHILRGGHIYNLQGEEVR